MQLNDDLNKRPLSTPEQLHIVRRGQQNAKKLTPRQEFERLFRRPLGLDYTAAEKSNDVSVMRM